MRLFVSILLLLVSSRLLWSWSGGNSSSVALTISFY